MIAQFMLNMSMTLKLKQQNVQMHQVNCVNWVLLKSLKKHSKQTKNKSNMLFE